MDSDQLIKTYHFKILLGVGGTTRLLNYKVDSYESLYSVTKQIMSTDNITIDKTIYNLGKNGYKLLEIIDVN